MGFAERSVEACKRAFSSGLVAETTVRNVLKSDTGGEFAVPWLASGEAMVRRCAARIVAEKGPVEKLVEAVLVEKDRAMMVEMIRLLGRPGVDLSRLEVLISSDDTMIRDAAIDMFVKAGSRECIFPLVFSDDDGVVKRTKRLLDDKGKS